MTRPLSKNVTTADFIRRAREVHGDKYDYSKTVYISAIKDVTIICPIHGEFEQRPANHNIGRGCRACGGSKPLSITNFVIRAQAKHRNRYDYALVDFKSVEDKIRIICPEHGIFSQRVMTHLKGFNCPSCGRESTAQKLSHSLERFLQDAKSMHGDRYEYSEVDYTNALTKVKIICREHGPFFQLPAAHIRGINCSKCSDIVGADKRRLTTEDFVEAAWFTHGDRYDYSKVKYVSAGDKVEIICSEHGSFWQSPINHSRGSGCPGCAVSGFDQTKPATLYYLALLTDNNETLYKIGITNLSVHKRFPNADLERIRTLKIWQFDHGADAADEEIRILREFEDDQYIGPDVLVGAGNTELFVRDVLGLENEVRLKYFKQWTQESFDLDD